MNCDFIQNYIKDGNYSYFAEVYPSCNYPKGTITTGSTKIFSTYECGNPTKFLQKNFDTVAKNDVGETINFYQKFDITCDWNYASSVAYNLNGKFRYCPRNNTIFICAKGYSNPIGKIATAKGYLETTSTGYIETFYHKENGVWIPTIKRIYTRL